VFATTDGSLLVVEEQDGSVSTRTIAVPGSDGAVAKAVAFDATGDLVVVVTAAGVPVVIDVRSSARVDTIDPTLAPKSLNARFRPDGKVLAVATDGGDIVRFNTKTWARIGEPLRGLAPTTVAMAYTPDGDELALMGEDDKARIIDLPTGQLVGEPLPAASAAASIAFARDGHVLLAATSNGMVVWDLDPAAWVVDACRAAGRNLTQEEWDKYLPGRSYAATCTQYR
jgi:WD40 repeat protein